jgi:hypothetical protein
MATIFIEGLGEIEIQGDTPNAEELNAIENALGSSTDTTTTDTPFVDTADVESGQATDSITPEMIDPNLAKVGKAEGLELIGGRPTFEAAGAIAGSVVGTAGANPATVVGGGVGGAMAGGQLYDIFQGFITEDPTNFGTQAERLKKDLSREALLQTIFAKIPGMFTAGKKMIFGKADDTLYNAAKRQGFPLSLSEGGNIIAKGYGKVIGVFPFVGNPIKSKATQAANFINKSADDTLNTFGPNVTLTKLGIDMTKASQKTYGEFRRVSSFFYDDFYKAVDAVGNTPIISTQNFKNSLKNFAKLVDDGAITLKTGGKLKDPRKDILYNYAKNGGKGLPDYINATQYKSLIDQIKYYSRLAQKSEPFNLKVLTGMKSALETDLRLLTKQSYQDNLLKNVYPLSKSKKNILDPNLLSDVATKLKFADKVYAQGLEGSIINGLKKSGVIKKTDDIVPIVGKKAFEQPVASSFKKVDKNIFKSGFEVPGSINADELASALLKKNAVSPQLLSDLRTLVGEKQFNRFVRARLQKGFDDSLVKAGEDKVGLIFNPYKFEQNLGLNTKAGRDLLDTMLKNTATEKGVQKLTMQQLDDFFAIAKNHAGLTVPDVGSFLQRRAILGGTKAILGGLALGATTFTNPVLGSSLIFMGRRTSSLLSNPKQLDTIMKVLDPNSTANQMKVASLKLMDAMISDSQTKQEENDFKLMRETIELMPLSEIKKGIEDTLNSGQQFLNMNKEEPAPNNADDMSSIKDDTSQLQTPPLETVGVNPASFDNTLLAQGTVDKTGLTPSEQEFLDDEEKAFKLRERGYA